MRSVLFALVLVLGVAPSAVFGADDGVAEFYAGHASLERGDAEGSVAHFTRALSSKSLDETQKAYVYHYRAVAYQKLGRESEAIKDYTQALALGSLPKRVQAAVYYNRAIALDRQEKYIEAVKGFTSAIALKPDYAEAYMNRGNAYRKLGERQQALRDYEASSRHGNPMKHLPYFGRGLVLEEMGDTVAAYEAFKKAASLAPSDFVYAAQKVADYDAGRVSVQTAATTDQAEGVTAAIRPNTQAERREPSAAVASQEGQAEMAPPPTVADQAAPVVGDVPVERPKSQMAKLEPLAQDSVGIAETSAVSEAPSVPGAVAEQAAAAAPQVSQAGATDEAAGARAPSPVAAAEAKPAQIPAPKPVETASAAPAGYLVQIASYTSEASALTEAESLKRRNPDVFTGVKEYIVKADLGARGTYWRLQYGTFDTREDSEAFCRTLKAKGLDCIVTGSNG